MKLTVNLVTWNGAKYVQNCLASLFNQTFTDFELLIIDNHSTDDTLELIREKYPHLKIVEHRENLGFAKAHNQAIHWTKSDYILVLNQDVILKPTFLENLVLFMNQNPQAGAATGKILRLQEDQKTNYIDTVGLKIFKNHRVIEIGAGEVDEGQYNEIEQVFGVSGAIPIYRRTALASVADNKQFFDEDFFSYKEDIDLAYRLRYAGWKAYKVPTAVAFHDRSVAGPIKEMSKFQIAKHRRRKSGFANYHAYRNHLYFLIKNLPQKKLKYLWPVFWYELAKFIYILFFERKNLKVVGEVWRNREKFIDKRKKIMISKKIELSEIDNWLV
jgi:GT2 family glycosyltransferase